MERLFKAHIQKQNQLKIEKKRYIDISYINFWTDKKGNCVYKVYMRDGKILDVDNSTFDLKYCPYGVNVINEVTKREYL